jgi:hypothetical protein
MRFRFVSASALLFSLVSMTGCSLARGLMAMPREAVEPLQSAHQIHLEVRAEEQKPAAERRPSSWYDERYSACEAAMGQARAHLSQDDMRPISSRRTPDGLHPADVQEGCYEVLRRAADAKSRESVASTEAEMKRASSAMKGDKATVFAAYGPASNFDGGNGFEAMATSTYWRYSMSYSDKPGVECAVTYYWKGNTLARREVGGVRCDLDPHPKTTMLKR